MLIDEHYTVKFTVESCDLGAYDWSYLKVQIKIRLESNSAEWKKVHMIIIKPQEFNSESEALESIPIIPGFESAVSLETKKLMDPITTNAYS